MTAAAIPAGQGLDAPHDRRRCAPAQRADRAPDPQGAAAVPTTFTEQLVAAERARHARLRRAAASSPSSNSPPGAPGIPNRCRC
jgi:hypothetical protein